MAPPHTFYLLDPHWNVDPDPKGNTLKNNKRINPFFAPEAFNGGPRFYASGILQYL